jgi:DNA-binding NarL/FixJ family response regulator
MNSDTPKIRVLLVDDHFVVRTGLASSLGLEPDIEVVGLASSVDEAVNECRAVQPDVVVMDWRMPGRNGVEGTQAVRAVSPSIGVVLFSAFDSEEDIYSAVQAGAASYLTKASSRAELLQAIRAVSNGDSFYPAAVAARLAARIQRQDVTPREKEAVRLILRGLSNKEIAVELGVSEATAKLHIAHLMTKLGARDRTHAASLALRKGIVHLD